MAHIDPHAARIIAPERPSRFELKIHEIAPEHIEPNGDRYIIEEIQLEETVEFGGLLIVTGVEPPVNPRDPQADPTIERRGVIAGVVIRAGNGHLLGLPDPWVVRKNFSEETISQKWASVDMFFGPGDVVLIDHNARGRALKIVGRSCRIVNQLDVLARIEGVHLERKDGAWVQVNE